MSRYIDADSIKTIEYPPIPKEEETDSEYFYQCGWQDGIGKVLELPTADVRENVRGEWISHYDYCKKYGYIPSGLISLWWCDQCEQGVEHPTNFCPNCGADMRGDNNE